MASLANCATASHLAANKKLASSSAKSTFLGLRLHGNGQNAVALSTSKSTLLIIVGSMAGNTNTLARNILAKANLGDLRGLSGGLNGVNAYPMIDGGAFDGAKAFKGKKVCNMLTMQEFHRRYHEKTGVVFSSLYLGCITTTGLSRSHIPLFKTLFPTFQNYITKGFECIGAGITTLTQVVSNPSLSKSGVYWSWNNDSSSFENICQRKQAIKTKPRKLGNKNYVRERPYGPPTEPPQPPPLRYQVGPNVNAVAGADRPQPVLGQQPPLPHENRAMIRYAQPYEAPQPMSNTLMITYYEEPNELYITEPEQPMYAEEPYQPWEVNEGFAPPSYVAQPSKNQYLVDERTLMFIANQNYKSRRYPNRERQPMGLPPQNQSPTGPCFNCGSPDHWERSCPHKQKRVKIFGFCGDCGIKNVLPECPRIPDKKGKMIINIVGVLPSASSGSKSKPEVQVNVVTRAQAKDLEENKPLEENNEIPAPTENESLSVRTQRKSWKEKRARMKARRAKSQTEIQEGLKAFSGGSVLEDKVLESLDALLQAWEARLKNNQTLEQRWLTYSQPEVETKRLEMCKKLVKVAQAIMEPDVNRAPKIEVLIHKELEKQGDKEHEHVNGPRSDTILSLDHRVVPNTTNEARSMELMPIPEVEEPWPQSLWETIRNRKDGSATWQSAPILEIVLDNEFYPDDIESLYGDVGTKVSMDSKPQSLKTLPSFIGEHKAKSEIKIVPSQMRAIPKMIDTKSLQEMLSTPMTCTITFSELLKIRLHL
ncbi:hypothetical protein L7F22_042491 [Adiantum nelumboides]|nr:hypothetical protein [Adiantum nelumboides]